MSTQFVTAGKETAQNSVERYAKDHKEQGIPVIGYYKEDKKYICLLPQIARETVRNNLKEDSGKGKNLGPGTGVENRRLPA